MKKTLKSILSLILVASTLLALAVITSCGGTAGTIDSFLTSDNYTFKSGKIVVKVEEASVYFTNGNVEKYLFYNKDDKNYYYSEINPKGDISKKKIDSERYIEYHETLVEPVGEVSKLLTGFLQVSDKLVPDENGTYTVGEYKMTDVEGTLTCTRGKSSMVISAVGSTFVEIPAAVISAKVK